MSTENSLVRILSAPFRAASAKAAPIAAVVLLSLVAAGCTSPPLEEAVAAPGAAETAPPELDLPRIPWEGGSAYWKQFAKPQAAGWSDPGFFPIVIWYNGISSDAEAQYDKSLGFNSYIGMADTTPYSLFADNNMFWIGGKLNDGFTDNSKNWVGDFLDDETDGRFATAAEGQKYLAEQKAKFAGDGRFNYVNFSQIVIGQDMPAKDSEKYVNAYTDVASVDMYWYTVPFCSWDPMPVRYLVPVTQTNCRTASSYGKTMESLRQRDATDGKLQSLWQFVEILNGGPGDDQPFVANITAGQLQGAVMNSLIHEARGLVYFNQSLNGTCTGGSIVRQTQVDPKFCAAPQVAAAGEINNRIHDLAPVLNSQSYRYDFGPGLDTMLKAKDGYAYIFSMVDDALNPGARTFTLPEGISGKKVEVLYENRSIDVAANNTFKDTFKAEYSYHIYKVKI